MANPRIFYKDNEQNSEEKDSTSKKNPSLEIDKVENKKKSTNSLWQNLKDNSVLTLVLALFPIATYYTNSNIADRQYEEKTLAEYVEFVKGILFDDYYSTGKDPRIPAESVSNFISSKTVTTLKTLENSDKQKELINFLKQAKIGFLPISEDPKSQDIPDKTITQIKNGSNCPLDYTREEQAVTLDQHGKPITPHPRITNPCLLTGINLASINLNEQDLSFVVLKKAQLRGAKLQKAQLQNANLREADLTKADLTEAYLIRTNLDSAKLIGANLSKADLSEASLKNADLTSRKVPNQEGKILDFTTDLTNANLTNANLQGAKLIGTILTNVNLTNANLSPSKVENEEGQTIDVPADLTSANLQGANLTNANLQGAKLDSQITEQKTLELKGVTLCRTTLPNGTIAEPECKP